MSMAVVMRRRTLTTYLGIGLYALGFRAWTSQHLPGFLFFCHLFYLPHQGGEHLPGLIAVPIDGLLA
jgi:hypothetical protein